MHCRSLFAIRCFLFANRRRFGTQQESRPPNLLTNSLFPQQPFDVGYEFSDLLFVCAVVETSDSPQSVNEDEAVAVDEIGSATFLLRRNFLCRHFETMPSQSVNRFFVARKEKPLAIHSTKILAILPQDFRSVVFGVNGNANDDDIRIIGEGFLNFCHVLVHDGADASTGCEEKLSNPDFALQVFQPKGFSVMSDQPEIGHRPIDRQPTSLSVPKVDKSRCYSNNGSQSNKQQEKVSPLSHKVSPLSDKPDIPQMPCKRTGS